MHPALLLVPLLLSGGRAADPASDPAADRTALLEGVATIEARGVPGPVVVFGPDAFAVLTAPGGEALVGAARHGEGRVVALGHSAYLHDPGADTDDGRLLRNAIAWAAGGREAPVVVPLRGGGALAGADVVTWAGGDVPPQTQAALRAFVAAGGGLVVGECPWGWQQLHPTLRLREDAPVNRVVAPMGLAFGPTTLAGPFPVSASEPDAAHAGRALRELAETGACAGAAVLVRAAQAVPDGDRLLLPGIEALLADSSAGTVPSEARPLTRADARGRLEIAWRTRRWEDTPVQELPAAPGAEHFPGAVGEDAPRVALEVALERTTPGWVSTGAYAPAGEVVLVRALDGDPRGWSLRIGPHTDSIAHHAEWYRWPSVSRSFELGAGATPVASPFGGLLYLEAGRGARAPLRLTLEGVVDAPFFDLAEPGAQERWAEERRDPAPWAELAGRHLVLTVPSAAVRALDDPSAVARYWDRVLEAHYHLAARALPERPERFVADVQISAGYMHAGYPIMTWLDVTRPSAERPLGLVLDVERLEREGSWGHFHELGHNCQRAAWTFAGTGEVTCNLFTLHAMDTVVGLDPWGHSFLDDARARGAQHRAAGAPFDAWQRDPFLALVSYAEVQHAFGWGPFRAVFAEYEALAPGERPRSEEEKRDQWLVRLSRAVGRDLGPHLERWGIPVSAAARAEVAGLEAWLPE